EASLTGYVDPERYPAVELVLDGPEVAALLALTRGRALTVLAGLVEANPGGPPFLTQIVARAGALIGHYRKRTIPPDEAHLFTPGTAPAIVALPEATIGLAICADIEHSAVFSDCARAGAQLICECAAPGLYGAQATRDWRSGYAWWRGMCFEHLARAARENEVYIAVATQAGRTVDEDFPGGGYVFAPDGQCLAETRDWSAGMLYASISLPTAAGASAP
ncbi:MAG TPA: nitrilase-related carbon-nitrogen hydrolase, partial [Ktedonobacterales bacterium]